MSDNFDVIDNQKIIYDDARNITNHLEPESVDVIVTSPPYNIGKKYVGDDGKVYEDKLGGPDYRQLLLAVFEECEEVLKKDGVFFLNIGDTAKFPRRSEQVLNWAEEAGFILLQKVVWVKSMLGRGHYTPSGGTRRFDNVWESIYILVKDRKNYRLNTKNIGVPYADKSNIGRYSDSDCKDPGNVWLIPYQKTTGKTSKKIHAAPYPIGIPYKCIKAVPDVELVLDPFAGLGTTMAAAKLLGVSGVGFELYPIKQEIAHVIKTAQAPKDIALIPHLETAIKLLSLPRQRLYKMAAENKNSEELRILSDVLKLLSLPGPAP